MKATWPEGCFMEALLPGRFSEHDRLSFSQRLNGVAVRVAVLTHVRRYKCGCGPAGKLRRVMVDTNAKTGGGATGTIRPSTSPRMPTSGFEDRGAHLSPCTPVRDEVKGQRRSSVGGRPSACNRRSARRVSRRGRG